MMHRIYLKLLQVVVLLAAAVLVGRPAIPSTANACANCETKTKCQSGLATGFGSCGVHGDGQGNDVCTPDTEHPCPAVEE